MKEGSVKVAFLYKTQVKKLFPQENSKCNSFELPEISYVTPCRKGKEQHKTLKCVEMRSLKDEAAKFFQD